MTTNKPYPFCDDREILYEITQCLMCLQMGHMTQAERHISHLEDYLAEMPKNTRPSPWRKWPEEKPERGEPVVVIDREGRIGVTEIEQNWATEYILKHELVDEITHWMPIPELPEEKNDTTCYT